jgi:serine/threonine-protein kinase
MYAQSTLALGGQAPVYPAAPAPPPLPPSYSAVAPGPPHPSHSGQISHPGVAPQESEGSGARLVLIALLSILVTSFLVVGGYMYYARRTAARAVTPPEATASPLPPVDVSVPTATIPPDPSAPADPSQVAVPPATASTATSPDPTTAPAATNAPPAATTAPPTTASHAPVAQTPTAAPARPKRPKKANCDNPFYVDAEGIKQIRPECM